MDAGGEESKSRERIIQTTSISETRPKKHKLPSLKNRNNPLRPAKLTQSS